MTQYYWVDGSGDFDDPNHWATNFNENTNPPTPEVPAGPPGATGDDAEIGVYGVAVVSESGLDLNDWRVDVSPGSELDAGSLTIEKGGVLGAFGTVNVSGTAIVGAGGAAFSNLFVSGGGIFSAPTAIVGNQAGSKGSVVVDGTQGAPLVTSTLNVGTLTVGGAGTGDLSLGLGEASQFAPLPAPANVFVNGLLTVGDQATGKGTINLLDPTCVLTANSEVIIGNSGTGSVVLDGGTTFNAIGQTITIGNQQGSNGTFSVSGLDAAEIISGNPTIVTHFYANSYLNADAIVVGEVGNGFLDLSYGGQATLADSIVLGDQLSGNGTLKVGDFSGTSLNDTNTQLQVQDLVVGAAGIGTATVQYGATLLVNGALKIGENGTGSLTVSDAMVLGESGSSVLVAANITVGGAKPDTANPDNGQDGNWTYVGGTGTLTVSSSGSITVDSTLTLLGRVTINPDGTETAQGGLYLSGGGSIEVGGGAVLADGVATTASQNPESILIDGSHRLVGHGLIDSDVIGQTSIGDSGSIPNYALNVTDNGLIEASDGLLALHGDITGTGLVQVDPNSTIEFGGAVSSKITVGFSDGGVLADGTIAAGTTASHTIIIDDVGNFAGSIDTTNFGIGDSIVLKNTNSANGNAVVAATIGTLNGTPFLEIEESASNDPRNPTELGGLTSTFSANIPIVGSNNLNNEFFKVTQSTNGHDTILTLAQGNPLDLAVNGPAARSDLLSLGGSSLSNITIAVISSPPEGDYMAQIIRAIAPGANVIVENALTLQTLAVQAFQNWYDATIKHQLTNHFAITDDSMSQAIDAVASKQPQVIVDDVGFGEPAAGSATENAIFSAVDSGITYITFAGNSGGPVLGHSADPSAITAGAINFLATPSPSPVGDYITPAQKEPFSSSGGGKPDIYAPDGGPTTAPLNNPSPSQGSDLHFYNPFFGTSAAGPVIAAVAAEMIAASNMQLAKAGGPGVLKRLLTDAGNVAAIPNSGAGFVQADKAVVAASNAKVSFYQNSNPTTSALGQSDLDSAAQASAVVTSATLSQPAGDANVGETLQFTLALSEAVTVAGTAATLVLNDGGVAVFDSSASNPAAGMLVFDYTVGHEQTANLSVMGFNANGTTFQGGGAAPVDLSAIFNQPTNVSINSPLVVTAVSASRSGEVQVGDTVELTITLDEALTANLPGGPLTLTLSNGATATYDANSSNLTAGKLVFDYTVQAGDASPDLLVASIDLPNGTTIQDSNKNNADFSAATNTDLGLQIGPAFVSDVFASVVGAAHIGQTVQVVLSLTESVSIDSTSGLPSLTLNDGASASYDANASKPSAGSLVFDYTIGSNDEVSSLAITQFNLDGAVITDSHGANVDFTGAINLPLGLTINSPLAVTSVSASQTGQATTGQQIQLTLNTNASATVDGFDNFGYAPFLLLNDGAIATFDPAASNPAAGKLVFDYTIGANDQTPNLEIVQYNLPGAVFTDGNGNQVDLSAALNVKLGLGINAPAGPPVSIFLADGSNANGSQVVTFEGTLVGTADPNATVKITEGAGTLGTVSADAHGIWTYSPTLSFGLHTIAATETDQFDNVGTASTTFTLSAPVTVSSISGLTDTGSSHVNTSHLVAITLTTSAPVTVTGTPTLQLSDGEVAAYTIGSGSSTLTFTYVVQPGDNAQDLHVSGLNLPNAASIQDGNGNPLSGPVSSDLGIDVDTTTVVPTTVETEIMGLYAALYNRAGEAGGYTFWVSQVAAQADAAGLTVGNSSTTAVTAHDAQVLGQGFVISQSTFFNATYGGLSDSAFINAMYVNIGGNAGDPGGLQFWSGLLQSAENAGQSVQDARAGLVGQFVQILSGFDTNNRPAGLTDQQWTDAIHRTETIDNKIATSIGYFLASQQPEGALLNPATVNDPAYLAAIRAIQGVTSDPLTAEQAISNIAHAVAAQDLNLIQPVGVAQGSIVG